MTTGLAAADRGSVAEIAVAEAAALDPARVLELLGASGAGWTSEQAARRLAAVGPNAVRSHHAQPLAVLGRQFRSAILVLLAVTAAVSYALGEHTDATIIGGILAVSIGLGFVNEYRAERATEALHSQVRHTSVAVRDGVAVAIDVTGLVPGDVVNLSAGQVVPADVRLLSLDALQCDESILTGESLPVDKDVAPVPSGTPLAELRSAALMGTVVGTGSGVGVVVATGGRTEFGRIALGLGERAPETDFQVGLRRFSLLLLRVAVVLTSTIFVINVALHRPLIDALLFSLAIAVGITPQLLPAVVSTSLATGSRQLARRRVLVKRLVCIEDLGDIDVLVTDKTGTITQGAVRFSAAVDPAGLPSADVLLLGALATGAGSAGGGDVGGAALDTALRAVVPDDDVRRRGYRHVDALPFDHARRMTTALVAGPQGTSVVTKGAPESVLARCRGVPDEAAATLSRQFAAGARVVAVATRPAPDLRRLHPADERDLTLAGFLLFSDPPKPDAAASLRRLASLGITTKIATGDNPVVALKVCADLGLPAGMSLTGTQIDALDDDALVTAAGDATVFARVTPEQKARVIRLLRGHGRSVGFLGDGVNDALALHSADVGISVDSATDVAKDAADVVLLDKDLGVLADGVTEGRRIFANTIKYVLMGTSSNFGNMVSAAAASAVLPFLPMLPSQILLNNLLYDAGQLSIPTDRVDPEQLRAPAHWDVHGIRRFMLVFGPVSSAFDFATFAVMLGVFAAGPSLFRSGWFVESLATQSLVIFAIRTRRTPFFRSRPSAALTCASLAVVAVGAALPQSPLAEPLGFTALPALFFLTLAAMVVLYLAIIELVKRWFHGRRAEPGGIRPEHVRRRGRPHRIHRRAARFTHAGPLLAPGRQKGPSALPERQSRQDAGAQAGRPAKMRLGRRIR